ncbi:MAG: transposase [Halioglobus sp.]|nr:transposase [Halioglobus sp.]
MARPPRLEFAGALYHVTSRGDRQEAIYEDDADRIAFLSLLQSVSDTHNWACHAYCLMGNHYHLLLETPDANLSSGMRQLNGVYTQSFNRTHGRVGHVFQGRYKSILVEKHSYLLELARYIVLNPVRAGMVRSAGDWPWSSYRATAGQVSAPPMLTTDWLLSLFASRYSVAIEKYKRFVAAGESAPSPWQSLRKQVFLGSDQFLDKMQTLIDGDKQLSEIPAAQRRPAPKSLSDYAAAGTGRNEAIVDAFSSGGYTHKEIGAYFGLHRSTVSGIIKNQQSKT